MTDIWNPRKTAYVRPLDSDTGCRCIIRFTHDISGGHNKAALVVQYVAKLAGIDDNSPRHIALLIRPTNIESCQLATVSNDELIPPRLHKFVPSTSVEDASNILTLTFTLNAPGAVLHPPNMTSVRPIDDSDADFNAFVNICRATTIHLHFSNTQFVLVNSRQQNEKARLENFVKSLDTGEAAAPPLDFNREDRGRGLQEGTWRVFQPEAAEQVLGKRSRRSSGSFPESKKATIVYTTPPPYSPTEVNTPTEVTTGVDTPTPARSISTAVSCNNIQPTVFTRPPPYDADHLESQASLLASMLAMVPEAVLRKAIIRSGHSRLLRSASPDADSNASIMIKNTYTKRSGETNDPSMCRGPARKLGRSKQHMRKSLLEERDDGLLLRHRSTPWLERLIDKRFNQLTNKHLNSLVKDVFAKEIETRLEFLVDAGLPIHTKEAIEKVMGDYRDQFYMDCQQGEADIQEMVEDASVEVKVALDNGVRDIEDLVREHIEKMAGEFEVFDDKAELELDNLKSWFVKFARGLFDRQDRERTEAAVVRCSSV